MERRRNFSRRGRFTPKPVEIGKEYEVDIKEMSSRGEGIARIEGLVTFVPNAKPGDHIKIRITKIRRTSAEAEIVKEEEAVAEEEETEEEE